MKWIFLISATTGIIAFLVLLLSGKDFRLDILSFVLANLALFEIYNHTDKNKEGE